MNDIFDLSNVSDLNSEIVNEIKKERKVGGKDQMILSLFCIKAELNINEILVGLARKHSLHTKKSWVSSRLHALCKKNKIEKVEDKRGVYIIKSFN